MSSHIEDALRKYEARREQIYKELEISFVQQKIRRKLMNSNSSDISRRGEDPIEFLFYDEEFGSSEEHVHENIFESKASFVKADIDDMVEDNSSVSTEVMERKPIKKSHSKASKYLDIEAEVSGDYENDSFIDNEGLTDEAEYIDNEVDSTIDLDVFAQERDKKNDEILKELKDRFTKKKAKKSELKLDPLMCESNDEFPEIAEMSLEQTDSLVDETEENIRKDSVITPKEEVRKRFIFQEESLFNNEKDVIDHISKKEDKKVSGFVEKKNI